MRPEDLETIRRIYRPREEGGMQSPTPADVDIEEFISLAQPDIEWRTALSAVEGAAYRGHEGIRRWNRDMAEAWEQFETRLEELVDAGDSAVAIVRVRGRGRGSGAETTVRIGHVWTFREGKAARMHAHPSAEQALDAVDLSVGTSERGKPEPAAPVLMGVLNVTPDSFSDGGLYLEPSVAVLRAEQFVEDGAQIVDVGGESTRPGAAPVGEVEELQRVMPVIERLASSIEARISIDTTKLEVARRAIEAGATIVNDVSAFRSSPGMAGLVAESDAGCCLMHMLGEPRTMQENPRYDDVVAEVKSFLEERLAFAVHQGVSEERIWLDPGIGFGKTVEHNLELIRRLDELVALGRPIVIGTSRKSFIGKLTGRPEDERLPGTIATNVMAYERGASVFRVHDVAEVADALRVAAATVAQ